ncbi:MAG: RagB/SusD family nutrient uptake outer membrane protein [Chitinophagaceae bacterium]
MRKYKLLLVFALLLFVTLSTSCKKYLDLRPDKRIRVPSTVSDLQGLLDNANVMNKKAPTYDVLSSDEYFATDAIYQSFSPNQRNAYIWENYTYNYSNDWSLLYEGVYYSNVVLDGLNNIERTRENSSQWDNVKGSALVYRCISFLKAAWTFSKTYDKETAAQDPGISLRTSSDFNQDVERATVADTYSKIIGDLMVSIPLLPEKPVHVMRPSRQAAFGLLARTYLSMRIYDSCLKYAGLCLSVGDELVDYNSTDILTIYPFGRAVLNKEVIMNQQVGLNHYGPGTTMRVDSVLLATYHPNDLRKPVFFRTRPDGYQFKGPYSGTYGVTFTGLATDEMILTRAECNARAGRITEAMDDINNLLRMRYITGTFVELSASTAAEALVIILLERRKELYSRGLRWMDIKRLNKEGAGIVLSRTVGSTVFTLLPNENRYALPLPQDIILLTGIPQNPR